MMMREPGKWPGVQLYDPKNQQSRLVLANEPVLPENKRVKVGLYLSSLWMQSIYLQGTVVLQADEHI